MRRGLGVRGMARALLRAKYLREKEERGVERTRPIIIYAINYSGSYERRVCNLIGDSWNTRSVGHMPGTPPRDSFLTGKRNVFLVRKK